MQPKSAITPKEEITVKIQTLSKTKILREVPTSFNGLKNKIAAQFNDDCLFKPEGDRNFTIKYLDGEDEHINVSDDDDLFTAYEVATKDLNKTVKFLVQPKQALPTEKKPKKEKKEKKSSDKTKISKKKAAKTKAESLLL